MVAIRNEKDEVLKFYMILHECVVEVLSDPRYHYRVFLI